MSILSVKDSEFQSTANTRRSGCNALFFTISINLKLMGMEVMSSGVLSSTTLSLASSCEKLRSFTTTDQLVLVIDEDSSPEATPTAPREVAGRVMSMGEFSYRVDMKGY